MDNYRGNLLLTVDPNKFAANNWERSYYTWCSRQNPSTDSFAFSIPNPLVLSRSQKQNVNVPTITCHDDQNNSTYTNISDIKYVQAPLSIPSTNNYNNRDNWAIYNTSIWPLIVVLVLVYLIWTEYGSQDCRKQNCNNRAGIIYVGKKEYNDDIMGVKYIDDSDKSNITTNEEIIDKISANIIQNHTIITWRRSMIASILIALVILFIFCAEFPHGFTVLLTVLIIFIAIQISANWFQAHWWLFNDYKIDESLKQLRSKLNNKKQ